jgi:uncharacterized protein YprB with RNaseH-like and TPR domain
MSALLAAAGAPRLASVDSLLRLTGASLPELDAAADVSGVELRSRAEDPVIAVLDIESLGLRGSGVLAFLVGIGLQLGSCLQVHQVLLADPGDEAALLHAVLDRLEGCAVIVTYNGRTFDVPALRARCIVNRLGDRGLEGRPHCDLLGPVRRLFRDRLGACTLRQAEIELLAMERIDDVPGFEAPGRYRAWLRGGGPDVLAGVVRHNELDLCATAVLGARLVAHVDGDMVYPVHAADCFRLAVHLDRDGAVRHSAATRAERLLREAMHARASPWDRRAAHRLAMRLRRRGGAGEEEALALWRDLWRSEPADLRAARALAIACQRGGLLDEAIAVSERSLRICEAMPAWRHATLRGAPRGGWRDDWQRRLERLRARHARSAREQPRSSRAKRLPASVPLLPLSA